MICALWAVVLLQKGVKVKGSCYKVQIIVIHTTYTYVHSGSTKVRDVHVKLCMHCHVSRHTGLFLLLIYLVAFYACISSYSLFHKKSAHEIPHYIMVYI